MSNYEIAVVLSAKLEDEGRSAVLGRVKDLVERFGGTVTGVEEWGKRKLAYPIQKMHEAFYYFVHFETENTDCPNEMEQQLRIMDGVIRYLVVSLDEDEAAAYAEYAQKAAAEAEAAAQELAEEEAPAEAEAVEEPAEEPAAEEPAEAEAASETEA